MQFEGGMRQYHIPSNKPLTTLIHDLHMKHSSRYSQIEKQLAAKSPVPPLPSFVTEKQYEGSAFKHDVFIEIIEKALNSSGWPADDHAVGEPVLRPNSDVAQATSGSKRSRSQYESCSLSTGNHISKRLNSSSSA